MKKLLVIIFAIAAISCGPSRYAVNIEMRYPSRSGLDLAGKIVSVVYESRGDADVDMFNESMADSFSKTLENEYGSGEGSVKLYCVDGRTADYSQKDSLVSLVIETGSDAVFLFQSPIFEEGATGAVPMKVNLCCYDGMNKEDRVFKFSGTTVMSAKDEGGMASEAADAGRRVADTFVSQWKHEQYSIAYYDSSKWYDALVKAEQYDWKGAMDIWFTLLDTNDLMKRASAEYNIAVACYMMGDLELAQDWLDKSVEDNEMPTLTDALRKRIEARKN